MRTLAAALLVVMGSLAGCNSTTIDQLGGLSFAANATRLTSPTGAVQTNVIVSNNSGDVFDVSFTCPVRTLFRTGNSTGPIVFDSRVQSCSAGSTTEQIAAQSSISLSEVSTPGLPSGTYFVTALLTLNGQATAIDAGTITF